MPCPFDGAGKLSLMAGADAGSFFCPDFKQTGNKPSEKKDVFKINFPDITLAQVASHKRK